MHGRGMTGDGQPSTVISQEKKNADPPQFNRVPLLAGRRVIIGNKTTTDIVGYAVKMHIFSELYDFVQMTDIDCDLTKSSQLKHNIRTRHSTELHRNVNTASIAESNSEISISISISTSRELSNLGFESSRPLVREAAFYAPRIGPSPYKQPRPLQREPAYYPLPINSTPQFPQFQSIGQGTLKRQPRCCRSTPTDLPCARPASIAAIYVVPRSVYIEEEKRVRFGGWTDQKMRRSSGSGRRHHVKSILKTPHIAPRQPRQLLKPGERLHKDGSSLSFTKVVLKGHHKSASSGSFTTSYWMQVDRWIDQAPCDLGWFRDVQRMPSERAHVAGAEQLGEDAEVEGTQERVRSDYEGCKEGAAGDVVVITMLS
ncbi:hypothetical protein CPB85DRAFT_1262783 [Mucidula mucida]|nr:hypothetical protein CPB85DRAFT_1262783 [Mucidula mucida]